MTVRKQEIVYGLNAVTNDTYHISEIEDLSIVPHEKGQDQLYEFSFKNTRDNTIVSFNSPKRDAIIHVSSIWPNFVQTLTLFFRLFVTVNVVMTCLDPLILLRGLFDRVMFLEDY